MELRQLSTFRSVARTLSFTRTAELLNYAQSSVTAQVQALEEELATQLFERLGRRVMLTDAGRKLLSYADRLLLLEEEARTEVSGQGKPSGTLVIGAVESICTYRLPVLLRRYQELHPQVQLLLKPGICSDLRKGVADGSLDLAFTLDDPNNLTPFQTRPLPAEDVLVLVPPEHRLAARANVGPEEFQGELVLHTEVGSSYRTLFDRLLAEAGVSLGTVLEFGSVEAIKQTVMAGLGFAVLPRMAVEQEVAQGRLVSLPFEGGPLRVSTMLFFHKEKWASPALSAFLDLADDLLNPVQGAAQGREPPRFSPSSDGRL